MSKKYTRMFTGLGYPADPTLPKVALPEIVITLGKLKCVTVPFPSEGRVTKVVVTQVAGTPVAFSVELLAGAKPYPPDQEQTIPFTTLADVDMFQVIDEQPGSLGVAMELIGNNTGYPFVNLDGSPTNNIRKLYLVIIPTSAGDDTTWDAAITCETDVG